MRLPRTDPELVIWLNNFVKVFETHAEALGFTADDITVLRNDAAMLNYMVGEMMPTYKAALQSRAAYKALMMDGPLGAQGGALPPPPAVGLLPAPVAPGIVPRLRQLIQRIQSAPAYNQSLGMELGIVSSGGGTGAPAAPPKPTAKATLLPNSQVRIDFVKGRFHSVLVEGRRHDQTDWAPLAAYNYSPYIDTRPPLTPGRPETREYRLRYLQRDQPLGDYSDTISTSTTP